MYNNYKSFLIPLYLFIFLFSFYSGADDGHKGASGHTHSSRPLTDEEKKQIEIDNRIKQEQWDYQQGRDRTADEREDNRLKSESLREQARERKEAEREMQDRCERAEEDIQAQMKEKKQEKEKWEEKFYDLEGKITELEGKNSEKQVEINEKLDELKKDTNEAVQDFKDDMAGELKDIDEDIKDLEKSIGELTEELRKVEETRMTAFYARRKQQNEFYSKCFGQALEQTEKERSAFYQRTATRTLKRQNIGSLVSGGKNTN